MKPILNKSAGLYHLRIQREVFSTEVFSTEVTVPLVFTFHRLSNSLLLWKMANASLSCKRVEIKGKVNVVWCDLVLCTKAEKFKTLLQRFKLDLRKRNCIWWICLSLLILEPVSIESRPVDFQKGFVKLTTNKFLFKIWGLWRWYFVSIDSGLNNRLKLNVWKCDLFGWLSHSVWLCT